MEKGKEIERESKTEVGNNEQRERTDERAGERRRTPALAGLPRAKTRLRASCVFTLITSYRYACIIYI